ncbi:methyltransferase domain-containing protein [Tundrisphaera sp. TA3]|uniref:methyltransferase domain-containing protein n=1 Tax=Tundrisphaera sp. TA3 TaxID=3435775 RepID=UPI003EC12F9C
MDAELASLFRCPADLGPLTRVDRPAPVLVGVQSGITYPIEGGIPRFAGDGYVASFGRQWNRYDVARDEEDEATFQIKTGVAASELAGKLVLDAGCGGGRYTRLVAKHGGKVVGVDLSAAVEKAQALCAGMPGVAIAQANLEHLPLAEGVFDFAFSIGVLHHGPRPREAFRQVARRVKPGGRFAVWLYRRNTRPQEWANDAIRAVTTRLPTRVLEPACAALGLVGGVPILRRTLNKVANFSNHPDWTLRVCDNFDWYAPEYQSHHTVDELSGWFAEEGYTDLRVLPPARGGRLYDLAYRHDLVIGSGVNVVGTRGA